MLDIFDTRYECWWDGEVSWWAVDLDVVLPIFLNKLEFNHV